MMFNMAGSLAEYGPQGAYDLYAGYLEKEGAPKWAAWARKEGQIWERVYKEAPP